MAAEREVRHPFEEHLLSSRTKWSFTGDIDRVDDESVTAVLAKMAGSMAVTGMAARNNIVYAFAGKTKVRLYGVWPAYEKDMATWLALHAAIPNLEEVLRANYITAFFFCEGLSQEHGFVHHTFDKTKTKSTFVHEQDLPANAVVDKDATYRVTFDADGKQQVVNAKTDQPVIIGPSPNQEIANAPNAANVEATADAEPIAKKDTDK
jgi:hypothetical protein